MPQLKVRSISSSSMLPACCSQANTSGRAQVSRSTSAARPSVVAKMRGRFSRMPPPVMWAMACTGWRSSTVSTVRA